MKKGNKLHIKFHNPNSEEETAKFLTKLIAEIAVEQYLSSKSNNNIYGNTKNDKKRLLS